MLKFYFINENVFFTPVKKNLLKIKITSTDEIYENVLFYSRIYKVQSPKVVGGGKGLIR